MAHQTIINNFSVFLGIVMAFAGACFGSFAALIIYRLPKGQSIVGPRSYCESCGQKLLAWHNIPIFSWLILRGRCYFCRSLIKPRSTIIEVIMALCLVGLYVKFGISLALIEKFFFVFVLICLAYIDLDTFLLPLSLLFWLMVGGLVFSVIYMAYPALYVSINDAPGFLTLMVFNSSHGFSIADRLLGAVLGAAFLSAINLIATFLLRKSGRLTGQQWAMGWGDPLLILAIGLFVGLSHLVLVLFLASAVGSLVGIASRFLPDSSHDDDIAHGALPYGPFLAVAAIYVYLI